MARSFNPHLRKAVLEVVDNQIRDNNPPQTRETLARLLRLGYPRDEARRMIARAVSDEIFEVLMNHREYDAARYTAALEALPQDDEPPPPKGTAG